MSGSFVDSGGIECSVHAAPKALQRELGLIFGEGKDLSKVSAVLTAQHSSLDLLKWGVPEVEKEKDRCLEVFMAWGRAMQACLAKHGCWTDFFDPCSGLPVRSSSFFFRFRVIVKMTARCFADGFLLVCLFVSLPGPTRLRLVRHPTPQVVGESSTIYSEAEGFALLRGYKTMDAGGCKVVLHDQWGTSFYPATLVTDASHEQIAEALAAVAPEVQAAVAKGGPEAKADAA